MEKDANADHDDATRSVSSLSSNYRACFVRDSTGFRSNPSTLDAIGANARHYLDRRAKNRSNRAGIASSGRHHRRSQFRGVRFYERCIAIPFIYTRWHGVNERSRSQPDGFSRYGIARSSYSRLTGRLSLLGVK